MENFCVCSIGNQTQSLTHTMAYTLIWGLGKLGTPSSAQSILAFCSEMTPEIVQGFYQGFELGSQFL